MGTRFTIGGADAQPGDEVAFYDPQGVLCGRYVVATAGVFGFVPVYGDEAATDADEGPGNGEVLTIRVWDASAGIEIAGSAVILSAGPTVSDYFSGSEIPPVWQEGRGFVLNIEASALPSPGNPPSGGGGGGEGGGGGGTPPSGTTVSDDGILTVDAVNTGSVRNLTVLTGVTLDNSGGTLLDATNSGTIIGGILSGAIANGGTISGDVVLEEGAEIRGGTVSGTISGSGTGAVLVQALVDGAVLSNVRIGPGCILTYAAVSSNSGLTLTEAVTSGAGGVDPAIEFLQDPDGNLYSPASLIEGAIGDVLSGMGVQAQIDAASGALTLSAEHLPGLMVPMKIEAVAVASGPDGVNITSDGGLAVTRNGVFMEVVPWPLDLASFSGALQNFGLSFQMDESGISTVGLPGGTGLSFRFDIIATEPAGLNPASATPTFSIVGNSEMPEAYTLMITYPDGVSQRMPPFVHDLARFREAMETATIPYRILPSSGIIELTDSSGSVFYRGRPGYLLGAAPAGVTGLSFQGAGDVNGDGIADFSMISPAASQIIYSLPAGR